MCVCVSVYASKNGRMDGDSCVHGGFSSSIIEGVLLGVGNGIIGKC